MVCVQLLVDCQKHITWQFVNGSFNIGACLVLTQFCRISRLPVNVQNVRHHNSTVHHEWLTVESLTLGQELVLQKMQQVWFE